jgi:hypothetical protein
LKDEIWKAHPNWEGYEISDLGGVRSWHKTGPIRGRLHQPRLLRGTRDRDGYRRVILGGKNGKIRGVHQLVMETFGPTPFEGAIVAHNNGDKQDNRFINLRWASPLENAADRALHGTLGLTLTTEDCEEIKRLYAMGFQQREIARVFRVTQSHINGIILGKVRRDSN